MLINVIEIAILSKVNESGADIHIRWITAIRFLVLSDNTKGKNQEYLM